MRLVYALPLLVAFGFLWLAVRHRLDRRRERMLRERLRREPRPPKIKPRSDSERSEMRAFEDATTVGRTIRRKRNASAASARDGDAPPDADA